MTAYNVGLLASIIIAAGCLGGLGNYLIQRADEPGRARVSRSVVLGVIASGIVPLFLKVISSDIVPKLSDLKRGQGVPFETFEFCGFCLLAAVFSRNFLEGISKRVLTELQEKVRKAEAKSDRAEQESQEAQTKAAAAEEQVQTLEPAVRKLTEPAPVTAHVNSRMAEDSLEGLALTTEDEQILSALANGAYSYRTIEGICNETKLPRIAVENWLENLRNLGLAGRRTSPGRLLWFLTNKGHDLLAVRGKAPDPAGQITGPA